MFDTVDLHNISNHALPDGLVVAVRAEHEEHVVRVVGVGRGHALVVDLRLVREGEVPLRLFQGREAALGTPRRERAGAQRAEGPGGQHRGGSAVGGDYGGSRGSSLASHCQLRLLFRATSKRSAAELSSATMTY